MLYESFFNYWSGATSLAPQRRGTIPFYKNPTLKEWEQNIGHEARGWAMPNGDIYMEGKKDKEYLGSIIHEDIVAALMCLGVLKNVPINFDEIYHSTHYSPSKYGISVIIWRFKDGTLNLYCGESQNYSQTEVDTLEKKIKLKNPNLKVRLSSHM